MRRFSSKCLVAVVLVASQACSPSSGDARNGDSGEGRAAAEADLSGSTHDAAGQALSRTTHARGAVAQRMASQIDLKRLMSHVEFLASEELQGRANGSAGAESAALYVEKEFRSMGLLPAGSDGFFHDYEVLTGVRVEGDIGMRDNLRGYEYAKDYGPLGFSSDGAHESDLIFVGYGVSAPEYGYDDYAGLDVGGKFVLAFLGEPGMKDPQSPFDGKAPTSHSDLYTKVKNAADHGAAGIFLTAGPKYSTGKDRVWRISQEQGFTNAGLMACHISRAAAASLVEPAGMDLATVQGEIDSTYRPGSVAIANQRVELKVSLRRLRTQLRNVVGKIQGKSDDAILLLANYDGHGMGNNNAQPVLHPSANENASGVAVLLEVAKILESGEQPERSLIFGCLSGRRLTSAGASAMTRDGVINLDRLDVGVNLFCLASTNEANLEVMGVSSGKNLGAVVEVAGEGLRAPVVLRQSQKISREGDHIPFYKEGIPTLTVFGGAFDEYGSPGDTPDQVDTANFVRRSRYVVHLMNSLANDSGTFEFLRP